MIVDTSKLIKVKTYADIHKFSSTWVYHLISVAKLTLVEIDGVKFVIIE